MSKKITFRELDVLYNGLRSVESLRGVKFAYAVAKNKRLIEQELKILENILKPKEGFNLYEKDRIAICEKYCVRDPNGKPIFDKDGNYEILNKADADKEFDILKEKHDFDIQDRQNQIDEFQKMMEVASDISLHTIPLSDVPQDISTKQMEGIMVMIKE